jgi:hypothetical protein
MQRVPRYVMAQFEAALEKESAAAQQFIVPAKKKKAFAASSGAAGAEGRRLVRRGAHCVV